MAAARAKELAVAAGKFIDSTPTPFHLCAQGAELLRAAGFVELEETEAWRPLLKPGGNYFYVRGGTLVAFAIGAGFVSGGGFSIIGAHTDSPVLKLKPCSKRSSKGYQQVDVEAYGGGLWHTWFDRELSVAGEVIVRQPGGAFHKRLVCVRRPLLRIPTLCIHLQTADERAKFAVNKETHLQPILGMVAEAVNKPVADAPADAAAPTPGAAAAADVPLEGRHAPALLALLGSELGCAPSDIMDFDLSLFDTQPAQVWGLSDEFLSAPRLDNQIHCFTALRALIDRATAAPPTASDVSVIALFDHEECGSESLSGAASPVMGEALQRVSSCFAPDTHHAASEAQLVSTRRSFLLSSDVAHAVHPNYAEKHSPSHAPKLNSGIVIKSNDNQRYATNAESGFVVRELARRNGLAVQEFMVKNDCACGATIGPIIAAKTGLRVIDLGIPSLSMHSIRETVGVTDIDTSLRLFSAFLSSFAELDAACSFACKPCKPT